MQTILKLNIMRTIETIVYKFDELSEQAKQKAIERLWDINVDYNWWNFVYDDAKTIGLKITEFDIERGICRGELTEDLPDVFEKIFENHGKGCNTYKLADDYKTIYYLPELPDNIERDFLHDLLEEYLIMLKNEYEYQTSEEAIIETIRVNEYEFTEDGKLI